MTTFNKEGEMVSTNNFSGKRRGFLGLQREFLDCLVKLDAQAKKSFLSKQEHDMTIRLILINPGKSDPIWEVDIKEILL